MNRIYVTVTLCIAREMREKSGKSPTETSARAIPRNCARNAKRLVLEADLLCGDAAGEGRAVIAVVLLTWRRAGGAVYAVNRSRNGLSSLPDPPAWCSVYLAAAKLRRRRRAPGSVMAARTALNVRSARERNATRPGRPADRLPVPTGNALWFVCWRARRAQGTPWPRRHRVATNSTFSAETIPPPSSVCFNPSQ